MILFNIKIPYKNLTTIILIGLSVFTTNLYANCSVDSKNKAITISNMNWLSNTITNTALDFILRNGFNCNTKLIPVDTVAAINALKFNKLDIDSEGWIQTSLELLELAKQNKVKILTTQIYEGATQGIYIPDFVAKKLPDLKKVNDLPKYADFFKQNNKKGKFLTCPVGWQCQITVKNLFKAGKFKDYFDLQESGSANTLDIGIKKAYLTKTPIVFYYWSPTPIMAKYNMVKLELPKYNEKIAKCISKIDCENPQLTDFPKSDIRIVVSNNFAKKYSYLLDFLNSFKIPSNMMSKILLDIEENKLEDDEIKDYFFKNYQDLWESWIKDKDIIAKIKSKL